MLNYVVLLTYKCLCINFFHCRMKQIVTNQTVKIPEGLNVTVKSRLVTVKGPRGVLKRSFKHLALDIRVSKNIYIYIHIIKKYF